MHRSFFIGNIFKPSNNVPKSVWLKAQCDLLNLFHFHVCNIKIDKVTQAENIIKLIVKGVTHGPGPMFASKR